MEKRCRKTKGARERRRRSQRRKETDSTHKRKIMDVAGTDGDGKRRITETEGDEVKWSQRLMILQTERG